MNGEVLHIGVIEKGATRVLRLTGELDSYTSDRLRSISETWIPGAKKVVVNLDKLDYVDSSGLAALVRMWVMAEELGVEIILACKSRRINQIFEITGLAGFFGVTGKKTAPQRRTVGAGRRAVASGVEVVPSVDAARSKRLGAGGSGHTRNPTSRPA